MTGQLGLICEGMLPLDASVEDVLALWVVRLDEARDACGVDDPAAQLDRYLIDRASARSAR